MTPSTFRAYILRPGLEQLHQLGGPRPSDAATRLLLAIALQESGLTHRYQMLDSGRPGPARGWWQFELGGVAGVMTHPRSRDLARALCDHCCVRWERDAVWRALEGHDVLAVGVARLLLWTDLAALPETEPDAWACYLRLWRPGRPHPDTWPRHWASPPQVLDQAGMVAP